MSKKATNEQRINEIINSIDGIRRATPKPFFYGRTAAKLEQHNDKRWERVGSLISKPAIAFVAAALVLLINVAVLFHSSDNSTTATQDEASVVGDNEYNNLSVSSLYDLNPDQNDIAQK